MRTLNGNLPESFAESDSYGIIINILCPEPLWFSTTPVHVMHDEFTATICRNDCLPNEHAGEKVEFLSGIDTKISPEKENYIQEKTFFSVKFIAPILNELITEDELIDTELSINLFFPDEFCSVEEGNLIQIIKGRIFSCEPDKPFLIKLNCVTGDIFVNNDFPVNRLSKMEFPLLPASSNNKSMPLLIGNFSGSMPGEETFNLAPALKIDEYENKYAVSHHQINGSGNLYYIYNESIKLYAKILSNVEFSNDGMAMLRHGYPLICEAAFIMKQRGTLLSGGLLDRYLAFLDDRQNCLNVFESEQLFLMSDSISDPGFVDYYFEAFGTGNLKLCIQIGEAVNGNNGIAAKVLIYIDGVLQYYPGNDITAADSNSVKEYLFDIPSSDYFRILKSTEFGFSVEPMGSVQFINMYSKIKFIKK